MTSDASSGKSVLDAPWDRCLDCEAPLIPCTCRPDCPGGMCSDRRCNATAPAKTNNPTEHQKRSSTDAV